jgi:pimeloyl-ACP methyl ester carboxylesterase
MPNVPIFLLPGMNGDDRLFRQQKACFPNLVVPRWITPSPRDSLASYARRLAQAIDPRGPCFIGGASFGGPVALETARHLDALACFLIGSFSLPGQLPWRVRVLRPLSHLGPDRVRRAACFLHKYLGSVSPRFVSHTIKRYAEPESDFLRWASLAILAWKPDRLPDTPLYHIHGELDRTLPARLVKADAIVPGCGHLVSCRAPDEVNQFLSERMSLHLTKPERR